MRKHRLHIYIKRAASLRAAFRRAAFVLSFIYLLFIVIFDTSLRSSLLRFFIPPTLSPRRYNHSQVGQFYCSLVSTSIFSHKYRVPPVVCPEGPSLLLRFTIAITFRYISCKLNIHQPCSLKLTSVL